MQAELEFRVGDVTTDMVEIVWKEAREELMTPGSPIHRELGDGGPDVRQLSLEEIVVEERNHCFGTTILVTVTGVIVEETLKFLWEHVLRPRLKRRFDGDAGEQVG